MKTAADLHRMADSLRKTDTKDMSKAEVKALKKRVALISSIAKTIEVFPIESVKSDMDRAKSKSKTLDTPERYSEWVSANANMIAGKSNNSAKSAFRKSVGITKLKTQITFCQNIIKEVSGQ